MSASKPPADMVCPFHRRSMTKVCPTCPLWVEVRGNHPNQEGVKVDQWGCSFAWLPFFVQEVALQTRGAAAATEQARNEITKTMAESSKVMVAIVSAAAASVDQDKPWPMPLPPAPPPLVAGPLRQLGDT